MPEGAIDLQDDSEGSFAAPVVKKLLAERKRVGDFVGFG